MDLETAESIEETVNKADCIILMTEWKDYIDMDLKMLKNRMSGNVIIDGRRAFKPRQVEEAGFDYKAIGLG